MKYFIAPVLGAFLGAGFRELVVKPEDVYSLAFAS